MCGVFVCVQAPSEARAGVPMWRYVSEYRRSQRPERVWDALQLDCEPLSVGTRNRIWIL